MLFNDFYRTDVRLYCVPRDRYREKNVEATATESTGQFVCNMPRRKNRLQSNQSRYKFGFYGINKCFVSENSHPHCTQTQCHCMFDAIFVILIGVVLSAPSTKICDWISFKFYVQPSQAFAHFTFDSFSMAKFRGHTPHNRISKYYILPPLMMFISPESIVTEMACKSNSI